MKFVRYPRTSLLTKITGAFVSMAAMIMISVLFLLIVWLIPIYRLVFFQHTIITYRSISLHDLSLLTTATRLWKFTLTRLKLSPSLWRLAEVNWTTRMCLITFLPALVPRVVRRRVRQGIDSLPLLGKPRLSRYRYMFTLLYTRVERDKPSNPGSERCSVNQHSPSNVLNCEVPPHEQRP